MIIITAYPINLDSNQPDRPINLIQVWYYFV